MFCPCIVFVFEVFVEVIVFVREKCECGKVNARICAHWDTDVLLVRNVFVHDYGVIYELVDPCAKEVCSEKEAVCFTFLVCVSGKFCGAVLCVDVKAEFRGIDVFSRGNVWAEFV